jgi:hypothetical protein
VGLFKGKMKGPKVIKPKPKNDTKLKDYSKRLLDCHYEPGTLYVDTIR